MCICSFIYVYICILKIVQDQGGQTPGMHTCTCIHIYIYTYVHIYKYVCIRIAMCKGVASGNWNTAVCLRVQITVWTHA